MATIFRASGYFEDVERGNNLVDAAANGDCDEVLRLLDAGVSVNADEYNKSLFYASKNYVTPLQIASAHGHLSCVKLLIERGGDLNARDRFDVTAAHMAAERGHYTCLKALLEAGSECCVPTKYSKKGCYTDWNARMHRRIRNFQNKRLNKDQRMGLYYRFQDFCRKHIFTTFPHPGGTTPLHLAAANNHVNCVQELIQSGADYNAVDERGRTSLFIAAQAGYDECVLAHLRNAIGRDILSLPGYETGDTPLHFAVRHGMIECVAELLDHGSDVNHPNYLGYSPLHYAVFPNCETETVAKQILSLLVINGYNTDVNMPDASGLTPLHYVCFGDGGRLIKRPELAAFLIAYGADTSITNQRGYNIIQSEFKSRIKDWTIMKTVVKSMLHLPSLASMGISPPPPPPPPVSPQWVSSNNSLPLLSFLGPWGPLSMTQRPPASASFQHPTPHHGTAHLWKRHHWYNNIASSPRLLQHYCRYAIRLALGYKRLKHVKDLPIPTTLQHYLLLEYDDYKSHYPSSIRETFQY